MKYVCKGEDGPLHESETKSLSAGHDPDGGYLIPQDLSNRIIEDITDHSTMRQLAQVIEISTDAVEMLADKGGADVGWVAETAERPETSTPELIKIRIPVHELYAKPRATQKLLDDARIDVESWLAGKIGHKMSELENRAFIQGDGGGKPKGFLDYQVNFDNNPAWGSLQGIKTGRNGGFGEASGGDLLIDIVNSLNPHYLNGSSWLMSRLAVGEVRKLKDKNNNYLWQNGLNGDFSPTLLGYPVAISDDMPNPSADHPTCSIAFGNFKEGYQIVDRQGTRVMRDPFSSKPYVEFYTTRRVGGDVVNFNAIKLLSFSQ